MMSVVQFFRPRSLEEALLKLTEGEVTWRLLAGGTDLIIEMRGKLETELGFQGVVDLTPLDELRQIEVENDRVSFGSMTTFSQLVQSELIQKTAPVLAEMASNMGSLQIRNRATVGGNIVNASACADSSPILLLLDAHVELASIEGKRSIALEDFILGPGRVDLRPGEILTRIIFPRVPSTARWSYFKLGRRNSAAISRMTVAALRIIDSNGSSGNRLVIGATTPKPVRLRGVEQELARTGWDDRSLEQAADRARQAVEEITGVRWSSAYKLPVVRNLVYRVLLDIQ
jgi:xanthine dehydrogenase FAD-binding subunit